MQTRNYCTHAIEMMQMYTYAIDRERLAADGVTNMHTSRDIDKGIDLLARATATLLHEAEKFIMPDWGRIFDERELAIFEGVPLLNRLPYPIVACEYTCDYSKHMNLGPHEMPSSRRIALCVEREAMKIHAPFIEQVLMPDDAIEGFVVMPICWFDERQLWTPAPSMAWIDRDGRPQDFKAKPLITPLGLSSYSIYPDEEKVERATKDFADEVITCYHMMLALSMERSTIETIPAPKHLNAKRAKKGKVPMFEYKVLDIVADIMEAPKTGVSRPQGKHASPRLHKRRGHVRRLSEDRVTWVRNTIVGKPSRGEIRKDYSVHS